MQSRNGPQWTQTKTFNVLTQYIAFLYLVDAYPQYGLVPSSDVDQIWHYHILDTQKYAEDCETLFGRMVHHSPYLGRHGEQDRRYQRSAHGVTQALIQNILGKSSVYHGTQPADCEPIR
ncbi:glycine-rich domain-containing protein-like [Leptolyngbya sp. FACHB-16]|nr:glycine-rich domain-containing protein-like [Leptolyngbya sp. FACHB-8]MBD2155805.1 glycine-rich domain-containing protein-like [Leptolyngbya sp. FACHB-16]